MATIKGLRMKRLTPFLFGFLAGALLILFIHLTPNSKANQPLLFNHKKHTEQGIECISCHPHFKTQTFSGLPDIGVCIECHKDPLTASKEEEKVRLFYQQKKKIQWKRIYEQPDHVFFSHRRHVLLGKMNCKDCHGEIERMERPPSKPWVKMTMKWCMDCHLNKKVTNDCMACHV